MTMRRFAEETQRNYLRDVGRFATWMVRALSSQAIHALVAALRDTKQVPNTLVAPELEHNWSTTSLESQGVPRREGTNPRERTVLKCSHIP